MKKTIMHCNFVILVLLYPVFSPAQQNGTEQITVPLSQHGKPGVLNINHFKGAVRVIEYDGEAVVAQATLRYPEHGVGETDLKRISSNTLKLSGTEKQNTVTITTNSHDRTVDLVIRVPRMFSLRLQQSDYGDITVQNVRGEMEINSVTGSIEMVNVSGSVLSSTVEGNIRVLFDEVTAGVPMVFSTIDGTIDITFPPTVNAFLKMKSDYGDIFSDFEMDLEKRKTKVEKSEKSGVYKVFLEEWTYGTINDGGPEFLFTTVHGNIYMRRRF